MKILMLSTYDEWGGAAKAAFRLNKGLQSTGIESSLLVQDKMSDAKNVIGTQNPLTKFAYSIRTVLGTMPVRLYPNKPVNNFSPALMPDFVAGQVDDISPDLIHLHWIGASFMRLETLKKLKQPIVWTLHDSWPFTGGCHMPYGCIRYQETCGFCPVLGSRHEKDLSRSVWQRKIRAWRGLNLTIVTPSRWLADCARSSSLFHDMRTEVIPNGLDLSIFKPIDKRLARDLLGLPRNKKFILFGGISSTSDPNKGFQFLLPALRNLSTRKWQHDTELVVFGSSSPDNAPDFGMKSNYLGRIHGDLNLAQLYSAADLFVAPSMQENLPYTIMEAMACGTPCVAFNQGGISDLIDHDVTGYMAQPFDENDLAKGIEWILKKDEIRQEVSLRCRHKVEETFALENVAARYAEVYRTLLET
jgi:glycosyltransferase involved in cell wall biosynthesis